MAIKVEFKSMNPQGLLKYFKSFEKSIKNKINTAGNLDILWHSSWYKHR